MSSLLNLVLMTLFTLSLSMGQLLFKYVGLSIRGKSLLEVAALLPRQPALYAALTLYAGATALWIWILARLPLAQAYTCSISVGLVLVPLLSAHFFSEKVPPLFWLGAGLIAAGLAFTQLSGGAAAGNP